MGVNGYKTKKIADEKDNVKTLWYNFVPHDKNDPVLLALFTKE